MDAAPDRVTQIQAEWRRERPDIDTFPQGVIGRLHRIGLLLDRRLDEVYASFDLSYAEFDILATLRRAGAPYQRRAGELADHTMVTSGGLLMTQISRPVLSVLVAKPSLPKPRRRAGSTI